MIFFYKPFENTRNSAVRMSHMRSKTIKKFNSIDQIVTKLFQVNFNTRKTYGNVFKFNFSKV